VLSANIDEREKKSAIVDFLAAGIFTLKNSLLLLLHQVAANPECQEKIIQDESKSYVKVIVFCFTVFLVFKLLLRFRLVLWKLSAFLLLCTLLPE